jgi:hypothetical protein
MPILGIIASSKFGDAGDFESIATVSVGSGGAANVEFTSIPSTYSHLQIRAFARSTRTEVQDYMDVRLNNDSGANYSYHFLQGDGSVTQAGGSVSLNQAYSSYIAGGNSTSGVFGVNILDILDYSSTNKNKTFRFLGGFDNNGSGRIAMMSDLWMNTNAVTSVKLSPSTGSFSQYSQFALYGIRSA